MYQQYTLRMRINLWNDKDRKVQKIDYYQLANVVMTISVDRKARHSELKGPTDREPEPKTQ